MSRRTKIGLFLGLVVAVGVGVSALTAARRGNRATDVRLEAVSQRDLVALVTASGKIEADTKVDVSSDITGRIVKITVREGEVLHIPSWVEHQAEALDDTFELDLFSPIRHDWLDGTDTYFHRK